MFNLIKGFGVFFVILPSLDPIPPHKITACLIVFFETVLFLANLMNPEMGETMSWAMKGLITTLLPVIFTTMLSWAWLVSLISTIWGGFLQHIFCYVSIYELIYPSKWPGRAFMLVGHFLAFFFEI